MKNLSRNNKQTPEKFMEETSFINPKSGNELSCKYSKFYCILTLKLKNTHCMKIELESNIMGAVQSNKEIINSYLIDLCTPIDLTEVYTILFHNLEHIDKFLIVYTEGEKILGLIQKTSGTGSIEEEIFINESSFHLYNSNPLSGSISFDGKFENDTLSMKASSTTPENANLANSMDLNRILDSLDSVERKILELKKMI